MNAGAPSMIRTTGGPDDPAKIERLSRLKQACADIESLFVSTLIKAMRDTIPDSGLMPEAAGSEIYESIANQQLSAYLSQGRGLGLGQTIFGQVARREDLAGLEEKYPALKNLHYTVTGTPALLNRMGSPAAPVTIGPIPK